MLTWVIGIVTVRKEAWFRVGLDNLVAVSADVKVEDVVKFNSLFGLPKHNQIMF